MHYHAKFGRSMLKGIKYGRTPKIGERWNTILEIRGVDDPVPVLHMYYHVKFGSSATKGVCINRRESPHIEERWSPTYLRQGRGLTRTTPSPYVLRRQIWLFCDKGCVHKNGRIPKTGQHWRRAPPNTCYHVNFGSAATKFVHINRREPPKLGCAWAPPIEVGHGWPTRNTPSSCVPPCRIRSV